jgi:1,4-alpha-glucan branching enzyme
MEIGRTTYSPLKMVRAVVYTLFLLLALYGSAVAQEGPKYFIKQGRMYIEVDRMINDSTLECFIEQYDLYDLPLKKYLLTNLQDTLQKMGWKVERSNKQSVLLSKGLDAFEGFDSPADRIGFIKKPFNPDANFPIDYKPAVYGHNRLRTPFTAVDSTVTFLLRGRSKAREVLLAGSFTNWQHHAVAMAATDSGWMARVKLAPGKHFYKFIIDGNWAVDEDNALRENDGRGNTNSVFYRTNHVFTLPGYPDAKKVYVVGSFNEWRSRELPLQKTAAGWQLPLYLADGTHTYKFVVDGQWHADKANPERLPDGRDGYNSVVRIGKPYLFQLDGHKAASRVVLTGSFNGWREDELQMTKTAAGWELPYVLGPGNYTYRFKVDGVWQVNPLGTALGKSDLIDFALVIAPNYTFRLRGHGDARSVFLAGTFNDWNPSTLPMQRQGSDWVFPVHLEPGKHLYKFIVDGKWILDPANELWEQNEHDTGNSVLWVE